MRNFGVSFSAIFCRLSNSHLWFVATLILFLNCTDRPEKSYRKYAGTTMGTYFSVSYESSRDVVEIIDSILEEVNGSVSTYDSTSLIRTFNAADQGPFSFHGFSDASERVFLENLHLAVEINAQSDGLFDPTVLPLVNFWGFGFEEKMDDLPNLPPGLMERIGLELIHLDSSRTQVSKHVRDVELDFSASAKGHAVDEIAHHLTSLDVQNYLVDIGGDMRAGGLNTNGETWKIGINRPEEGAGLREYEVVLQISDYAVTTSGNYRNFRTLADGRKVSHSINPITGYPERSNLLSATVLAKECGRADALSTACMILGVDKSLEFIEGMKDIEVFLIYADSTGDLRSQMTDGFKNYLVE